MAERGFYDPKREFPQTNAQDLIGYREFYDLDYAMPKQREGGVTPVSYTHLTLPTIYSV